MKLANIAAPLAEKILRHTSPHPRKVLIENFTRYQIDMSIRDGTFEYPAFFEHERLDPQVNTMEIETIKGNKLDT
jgi:hypothetical protein